MITDEGRENDDWPPEMEETLPLKCDTLMEETPPAKYSRRAKCGVSIAGMLLGIFCLAAVGAPDHMLYAWKMMGSLYEKYTSTVLFGSELDVQGCVFKTQRIPCYGHEGEYVMAEFDITNLPTIARDGKDLGLKELENYSSTHEVLRLPHGALLISQQNSNSVIYMDNHDPVNFSVISDSADRSETYRRMQLPLGAGVHGMRLADKGYVNGSIVFLIQEYSSQIQVYEYATNTILFTWDIPWQQAGLEDNPNTKHVGCDSHTLVLDSVGNIFFTMKNVLYSKNSSACKVHGNCSLEALEDKGQGAIGKLERPMEFCACPPCMAQWTFWRMSDYGTGAQTLPFYITADPMSRYIWFQSIISSEVGFIDTHQDDQFTMFEMPRPPFQYDAFDRESLDNQSLTLKKTNLLHDSQDPVSCNPEEFPKGCGARPGGIFAAMNGEALVAVYNAYGVLAKVNTKKNVTYTLVGEPDQAFLHVSASRDKNNRSHTFDVLLTGSTNDFQGNMTQYFFGTATQKDMIVILRNFNIVNMTWTSKDRFFAPTQNSWFHRGWMLEDPDSDYHEAIVTELYADRLFFLWRNKTWPAPAQ